MTSPNLNETIRAESVYWTEIDRLVAWRRRWEGRRKALVAPLRCWLEPRRWQRDRVTWWYALDQALMHFGYDGRVVETLRRVLVDAPGIHRWRRFARFHLAPIASDLADRLPVDIWQTTLGGVLVAAQLWGRRWIMLAWHYGVEHDECPNCLLEFDIYEDDVFVCTASGTYYEGEPWWRGVTTCPRCTHRWETGDSA